MKESFTTGEVARICRIAPKTVINYCEAGKIRNLKSPITNYRRIPRDSLLEFMRTFGIPDTEIERIEKKSILIVEDDKKVQKTLQDMIKEVFSDRVKVASARDGYEALLALGTELPDLLVLDIGLPSIDGYEVCKRIREHVSTRGLRILAITGLPDKEAEQKILQAGADSCLRKPIKLSAFKDAMATLLWMRGVVYPRDAKPAGKRGRPAKAPVST